VIETSQSAPVDGVQKDHDEVHVRTYAQGLSLLTSLRCGRTPGKIIWMNMDDMETDQNDAKEEQA